MEEMAVTGPEKKAWGPARDAAFHDLRLRPALSKASPTLPDGRMPFPFTRVFFIQERA